jgi:hypothetical protein
MNDDIFRSFLRKFIALFVDDIIIYSRTFEEHLIHIEETLIKLEQNGVTTKAMKMKIAQLRVEFLGMIVDGEGQRPHPDKIAAILGICPPTTRKLLRSFLGMAGYLRTFVPGYAKIAKNLTDLLGDDNKSKNAPIAHLWGDKEQKSFDELKNSRRVATRLGPRSLHLLRFM